MSHLSPKATVVVTCNNDYAVLETFQPGFSATQIIEHSQVSVTFFTLPTYTTSQNAGCPILQRFVTTQNSAVTAHPGLDEPVDNGGGIFVVKPKDINFHGNYAFFIKIIGTPGPNGAVE